MKYILNFYSFHLFAVTGTLKGYDQLLNLVLDEAVEFLRGNILGHVLEHTQHWVTWLNLCIKIYFIRHMF